MASMPLSFTNCRATLRIAARPFIVISYLDDGDVLLLVEHYRAGMHLADIGAVPAITGYASAVVDKVC